MLVVTRFRVPEAEAGAFRDGLEEVRALLAARPGCLEATVGRNADDVELWLLASRWEHVGAYRRALSSHEVKMHTPLLGLALDEPTAYEVVEPGTDLNTWEPRSLG